MLLQGNQRGGARDLALHLLKEENDHVQVHEIRGFISDDLVSALKEVHAVSRGTRCKQFLYSLSLNPPLDENVSTQAFEDAVERVEKKLGLDGQPRAIVFHEKQGRRHAHAVWSRINVEEMKAVQLSHSKMKLKDVARELYLEHGWKLPDGYARVQDKDPTTYTLAEWQQAKRNGKNPREIKEAFQESWSVSDTQKAFSNALKSKGYVLARGDRRNFVAVDHFGEVYSVSKWAGIKAKEVRSKLGVCEQLPTVNEARSFIARSMETQIQALLAQQEQKAQLRTARLQQHRNALIREQTRQRKRLLIEQEKRQASEIARRQARFNKGLRGLLERITGKRKHIQEQNEREALLAARRDQRQRDSLIFRHLEERRCLVVRKERIERVRELRRETLASDAQQYRRVQEGKSKVAKFIEKYNSKDVTLAPDRER